MYMATEYTGGSMEMEHKNNMYDLIKLLSWTPSFPSSPLFLDLLYLLIGRPWSGLFS